MLLICLEVYFIVLQYIWLENKNLSTMYMNNDTARGEISAVL